MELDLDLVEHLDQLDPVEPPAATDHLALPVLMDLAELAESVV